MKSSKGSVINLDHAQVISKGSQRICFIHPQDDAKCIKVQTSAHGKQHRREFHYFSQLNRRNVSSRHLPDFHGAVETNKGTGLVFSLVQNYDGTIAENVKSYIAANGTGGIAKAVRALQEDFLKSSIITCDASLNNFLVRRPSPDAIELVMIDGVGNREFIPLSSYIPWVAKIKMRRRLNRQKSKFFRLYGINVDSDNSSCSSEE